MNFMKGRFAPATALIAAAGMLLGACQNDAKPAVAAAPEIPTLVEKKLPFVRFGWLGICAGAGTPQPVIATLNRHIAAAVRTPDYRRLIEKAGSIPLSSTPEELARILAETYEQTAATVAEFGLAQD